MIQSSARPPNFSSTLLAPCEQYWHTVKCTNICRRFTLYGIREDRALERSRAREEKKNVRNKGKSEKSDETTLLRSEQPRTGCKRNRNVYLLCKVPLSVIRECKREKRVSQRPRTRESEEMKENCSRMPCALGRPAHFFPRDSEILQTPHLVQKIESDLFCPPRYKILKATFFFLVSRSRIISIVLCIFWVFFSPQRHNRSL